MKKAARFIEFQVLPAVALAGSGQMVSRASYLCSRGCMRVLAPGPSLKPLLSVSPSHPPPHHRLSCLPLSLVRAFLITLGPPVIGTQLCPFVYFVDVNDKVDLLQQKQYAPKA